VECSRYVTVHALPFCWYDCIESSAWNPVRLLTSITASFSTDQ